MLKKRLNRTSERSVEAIEYALLECLQNTPLKTIKISDVCDRARVSRPTFYAHFADKEDVLAWHIARQLEPVSKALLTQTEPAETEHTRHILQTFFTTWHKLDAAFNVYRENNVMSLVRDHYLFLQHEMYERHDWLKNTLSREDADLMFAYFTGALFSVLDYWMAQNQTIPIESLTQKLMSLMPPIPKA